MSRSKKHNSFTESGVVFILAGLASIVIASRYPLGAIDRMGPGFFPLVLACALTVLGTAVLVVGLRARGENDAPPALNLRSFAIVIGAIVFFGLAINHTGLLITVPVTVFFASFARESVDWRMTSIVAIVMTLFTVLVFVFGLDMRIPVLPGRG